MDSRALGDRWFVGREHGSEVLIGPASEAERMFPRGIPQGAVFCHIENVDYEVLLVRDIRRQRLEDGTVEYAVPPPVPPSPRRWRRPRTYAPPEEAFVRPPPRPRRLEYDDDYQEPEIRYIGQNHSSDARRAAGNRFRPPSKSRRYAAPPPAAPALKIAGSAEKSDPVKTNARITFWLTLVVGIPLAIFLIVKGLPILADVLRHVLPRR